MKNWKTLLLGVAMVANTSFAAPQVVDKVAAVVNNGVVFDEICKAQLGPGRSTTSG